METTETIEATAIFSQYQYRRQPGELVLSLVGNGEINDFG
jgi:hypothetical protein